MYFTRLELGCGRDDSSLDHSSLSSFLALVTSLLGGGTSGEHLGSSSNKNRLQEYLSGERFFRTPVPPKKTCMEENTSSFHPSLAPAANKQSHRNPTMI